MYYNKPKVLATLAYWCKCCIVVRENQYYYIAVTGTRVKWLQVMWHCSSYWAPLQMLTDFKKSHECKFTLCFFYHLRNNNKISSFVLSGINPVFVCLFWFAGDTVLRLLSGCIQGHSSGRCWLRFETSGCCGSEGPHACRQARPHRPPPTARDEAAILASGYKNIGGENG